MKIITGVGRSGTSLVANILSAVGTDLGESSRHLPPDENNIKGYFEDLDTKM